MWGSNLIKAIGVISLTASLLVVPQSVYSKPVTIKIATLAPEGSAWLQPFHDLNAAVRKKTNDRVRFKIYPGGVLGDEKDMRRKMKKWIHSLKRVLQIKGTNCWDGLKAALFACCQPPRYPH